MDGEGCERRVKKSVEGMKGPKLSKLTVEGFVQPSKVVQRVMHRMGLSSGLMCLTMLSHTLTDLVPMIRRPLLVTLADPLVAPLHVPSSFEVKYTSDDNPNACTIM